MTEKQLYKIISTMDAPTMVKYVNDSLAEGYSLAWELVVINWTFYQAMVDSSLTWLEIKKWTVVVSGTITTKEW